MKKIFSFSFVCVFSVFASVFAQMPSETFDLTTGLPAQGTNWYFDADFYYNCEGNVGHHLAVNCPAHPRNDVPTLFVNNGANIRITGTSDVDRNIRIQVSGTARITLDNASVTREGHSILKNEPKDGQPQHYITVSPMQLEAGAFLTLTLVGENFLIMKNTTNSRWSAGLGVPDGADLVIEGEGKLTAMGGISAAGIGGHQGGVPNTHFGRPAGNITINGGTIIATGRELASGIGSGSNLQGGNITINGGDVTAQGGSTTNNQGVANGGGAGIGGGGSVSANHIPWLKPTVITINGGTVRAQGGGGAAGIGSGGGSSSAQLPSPITININGGNVTGTGGSSLLQSGAGIGGGEIASGGNINIRGGTVFATTSSGSHASGANSGGAGIGGGSRTGDPTVGNSGNINISGGAIFASGGVSFANDIGSGSGSNMGQPVAAPSNEPNVRISPDAQIGHELDDGN